MNRLFLVLAAVSVSTAACTDRAARPAAPENAGGTPLMVSAADLKWTELPEVKGTQFAVLSGDPKTGEYSEMRKIPAGTNNPLHTHSSEIKMVIISGVLYTGSDLASARDFGPGVGHRSPSQLGARQRLPRRKRLRVLRGGQGEIRLQPRCGGIS